MDFLIRNRKKVFDWSSVFQKKSRTDFYETFFTETKYKGLDPITTADSTFLVLADPLLKTNKCVDSEPMLPDTYDSTSASCRTKKYFSLLYDFIAQLEISPDSTGFFSHVQALAKKISIEGHGSLVFVGSMGVIVITDIFSSAPIFFSQANGDLTIASSPEFIAKDQGEAAELDPISVVELFSCTQLSFPNTLWKNVQELPPGSIIFFSTATPQSSPYIFKYWTPPLPEEGRDFLEMRDEFHSLMIANFENIASSVSPDATLTLSAGLDSRFLGLLNKSHNTFQLDAVTIAPCRNIEFRIACRVSRLLGIDLRCHMTRVGSLENRMLFDNLAIPSHIDRTNMHFFQSGLGNISKDVVIGGYMADTVLKLSDPFFEIRRSYLSRGILDEREPIWSLTKFRKGLDASVQGAITDRWSRSDRLLGITRLHVNSLTTAFPCSRQGHVASFFIARREYPMYEPFMMRSIVDFGFRIPMEHKISRGKVEFYRPHVNNYLSGLLHPDAASSVRGRIKHRFKDISHSKKPRYARYSTAWGSLQDMTLQEKLNTVRASARRTVMARFPGDYSLVPDNLVLQVYQAIIRNDL